MGNGVAQGRTNTLKTITCLFLSLVLAAGLVPIFPNNQASAEETPSGVADTTATTAQVSDSEVIIVYENEALALDEPISVDTVASGGETADDSTSQENASRARSAVDDTAAIENDNATEGESGNASSEVTLQDVGVVDQEEIAPATSEQGAVAVAQLSDDTTTEDAIHELEETPGIAYVQPNYSYSLLTTEVSDPYCVASSEDTTSTQQYLFDTKTVDAWDYAKVEGGVTVAVIDTGCNLNHPDLQGTLDTTHAFDVTTNTLLAQSGVANNGDAWGHGTLVAGVIAAQANNGQGIAGASYNANVLPIKVFDENNSCTSADIIAAYAYLDELRDAGEVANLRVINLSLGYYASGEDEADQALQESIAGMLNEHGVLTVCAGGNGDSAGQASTATCYPSDFEECLSVTALDESGANASFSDYNAAKDISAPGVNILSTDASGDYAVATGTSMAAPQVAAAAALLWAADASLSAAQVVSTLEATASEVFQNAQPENGSAGALNAQAAVANTLGVSLDEDLGAEDENEGEKEGETSEGNNNATQENTSDVNDPEESEREAASTESDASSDQQLVENSWRYENGERIYSTEGASTSNEISVFSKVQNQDGYYMFNWFDQFSNGYYTGTNAYKGIDVSEHNGTINWAKVKASGVDYAIIRCGYGNNETSQDDAQWLNNVKGCIANGIPFGVYIYSYATNTTMAKSEADHVLRLLSSAGLDSSSLSYPVYFDMEDSSTIGSNYASIATKFCSTIEAAGYTAGIYANKTWFTNYLTNSCFNNWTKWVAEWNASIGLTYEGLKDFTSGNGMWQFSDYGSVPGITGRTDLNYTFISADAAYSAVYDYDYYIANNPDVAKAYNGNRAKTLQHFINYGMSEGRQAKESFDVVSYYNAYQDLRKAYGTNLKSYYTHYIKYGQKEGRTTTGVSSISSYISSYNGTNYSAVYNGSYYIANNSDLKKAYTKSLGSTSIVDDMALIKHFVNYGMSEGRQAKESFDVVSYYNANQDLRRAYGTNLKSYYTHYIKYGQKEGRTTTGVSEIQSYINSYNGTNYSVLYDGSYYRSKYGDLDKAFSKKIGNVTVFDDTALIKHFVNYGMSEGRQASSQFNVYTYRNAYSDLRRAYGSNLKAYYLHYIAYGVKEGRVAVA